MKIEKVTLHNFRGIVDTAVCFCSYTLLVGQNNAGKSTIIDALRAFYEKDGFKYKPGQDFPFVETSDRESWIDIVYSLSDEEWYSLAEDYKADDHMLRLRKYFHTTTKTHDDKPAVGIIFGYKADGTISNEPFYGAKNVQSGKIGDVVYIPAVSKVDEHTKLSGPSVLRDLLANVLEDVVDASPALIEFNDDFTKFSGRIVSEETPDGRSLEKLQKELNNLLLDWGASFNLRLSPPSTAEIIKSMLSHDFIDNTHGKALSVDKFGSGFQRHFIYSLIQVGARYIGRKSLKKTKEFSPNLMLILFEEPEAFLHPPQQEAFARSLAKLASTPDRQIVCSTHSPHFVSKNALNMPSLIKVKRVNGYMGTYQIDKVRWEKIVEANQVINALAEKWPEMAKKLQSDDLKPEMESVKNFLWLNPDRCSMFFADHVLLVEGTAEQAFINKLIGDGKITDVPKGLYVLDCLGKYNIHRFMNLMASLGIVHSVMHDDDLDQKEHEDLNALIHSCNHKEFTVNIQTIRGNIERFLDVPPPKLQHRKPQHLLYLYETGKIGTDKLSEFIELVSLALKPSPRKAA